MPNLVLTYQCDKRCPYCFAKAGRNDLHLSSGRLKKLLPFIRRFNRGGINLVGGEPTRNPEFVTILKLLLKEGYGITVFTNGNLSEILVRSLKKIYHGEYSFCVNRTDRELNSDIIGFYKAMGYRIEPGVTVFEPNQSFDHLFDEIIKYKLNSHYRLGIALPVWPEKHNRYLPPEDYSSASENIFETICKGADLGIKPSFDCGFPACFFSEVQKFFFEQNDIHFSSNCGVIPDIRPDFSAIPCFPLSSLGECITSDTTWEELQKRFVASLEFQDLKPLFESCNSCVKSDSGQCSGGCLALRLHDISIG